VKTGYNLAEFLRWAVAKRDCFANGDNDGETVVDFQGDIPVYTTYNITEPRG
jgi:hypothetical protein